MKVIENPGLRNKIHVFRDRSHAGKVLADFIDKDESKDAVVMAIPCGGVEVAVQIIGKHGLQFDLAITRKIHIPWNREAGFGAVSWDGTVLLNEPLIEMISLSKNQVELCK